MEVWGRRYAASSSWMPPTMPMKVLSYPVELKVLKVPHFDPSIKNLHTSHHNFEGAPHELPDGIIISCLALTSAPRKSVTGDRYLQYIRFYLVYCKKCLGKTLIHIQIVLKLFISSYRSHQCVLTCDQTSLLIIGPLNEYFL